MMMMMMDNHDDAHDAAHDAHDADHDHDHERLALVGLKVKNLLPLLGKRYLYDNTRAREVRPDDGDDNDDHDVDHDDDHDRDDHHDHDHERLALVGLKVKNLLPLLGKRYLYDNNRAREVRLTPVFVIATRRIKLTIRLISNGSIQTIIMASYTPPPFPPAAAARQAIPVR
jgi:hypothetical protein